MMALTEHEWKCNGDVDNNNAHETQYLVTSATFGTDPKVPICPECEQPMKKVYSVPYVNYDSSWYLRRGS